MSEDYGIREHVGIAVDGGGVRGAIVAQGLIELEHILGVERLIDSPKVKVVAGTSTGSIIAGAVAAGLSGAEILSLYQTLGERAFAKAGPLHPFGYSIPLISRIRVPIRLVRWIDRLPGGDVLLYALLPARYSFDPLRGMMRDVLHAHPIPNDNPTLGEVGDHLRATTHGPTIIITAAEVAARRTHFLKTTADERYKHMTLVDAMLASSCIPTYYPPVELPAGEPVKRWLVDGGVGSFGNPALVVAWELCDTRNPDASRHYDPAQTTVFSFGTGTVSAATYRREHGAPTRWWALDWASRAIDIFMDTAIREQSRNIVYTYQGIDLRRFQVELAQAIDADRFDLLNTALRDKGEELRSLIRDNRHALNPDPALRHDPEGIWHTELSSFVASG
jgi:predicted acylesterase/phospholipase RssA